MLVLITVYEEVAERNLRIVTGAVRSPAANFFLWRIFSCNFMWGAFHVQFQCTGIFINISHLLQFYITLGLIWTTIGMICLLCHQKIVKQDCEIISCIFPIQKRRNDSLSELKNANFVNCQKNYFIRFKIDPYIWEKISI